MAKKDPTLITRTLAALILLTTGAYAQTVSPATNPTAPAAATAEPVIELSPFVVTEGTDVGWVATESLAGSRFRTNLKDIPNQIETLTKDFMDDLGMTSLDQALIYTANVENQNDYMQTTTGNPVVNPGAGGRVRGISAGTLTRNFFQVRNPTDNYNVDRVTVASGPNAILFGLGSPAGILDATTARALMRNKYSFSLQYDSENSKRATFDANTVVVPKKLALRVMGLSKREYTEKMPNLDRDDRLYGAVTFTPFKNTTLTLQGERDNRNWNRAGRINPYDSVSLWARANQIPGSGYTVTKPVFNNTSLTGIGSNLIFAQASTAPVLIPGGPVPLQSWRNSVTVKNPSQLPGVDPTFDAAVDTTILDPGIFPFDANIVGTGRTTLLGARTKTVTLEQKLADNLFIEFAYNNENAYSHKLAAGGGGTGNNFSLNVDANQFIPGTTTPNPNLGKLYYQGLSLNALGFDRREDWRATLSYELDLARKLSERGRWAKWLGHHRFAGLYTGSKADSRGQQKFQHRILDDPVITGDTLRAKTFQNWAIDNTRLVQYRHYFNSPYDATVAAGPMTGDFALTDANGKPFNLFLYDTPLKAADGKRLAGGQVATGNLNKTDAQVLVWQGFFLPDREKQDRLVVTYGYRKDSAKSALLDAASSQQDFSGLFPVLWDTNYSAYGATQTGINRNLGVVARPLKWLSVFYNQSTTFDLNIGKYDPFGNEISGANGKGKDYGLRFDLWQNKAILRINKYENSLGPTTATIDVNRDIFFNLEDRVLTLDPAVPTINVVDGNKLGFRVAGRPNYPIMSDFVSTGYEVELSVTPVRDWNIRVNGSIADAVESNIGGPWIAWAAQRLPVWQGVVAKNGEVDAAGQAVTWKTAPLNVTVPGGQTLEQYYNSALVGQALAYMQAADGHATDSSRGARANLITNYRFSEGRLKGFNIGGAGRWRAAPTIGYGVTASSTGSMILNLDQAYKGKEELYFDAVVGYRGRLKAFGGFGYRLQLNVRNVLDEHDPVPTTALTTGAIAKIATIEPRVMVFTFTVDF